jgi:hypothetical protein
METNGENSLSYVDLERENRPQAIKFQKCSLGGDTYNQAGVQGGKLCFVFLNAFETIDGA